MLSPCNIVGIHACTVGVPNAPRTERITSNILITARAFLSVKKSAAHRTDIPINAFNVTIILSLFTLSARIPPNGESIMVGIVDKDNIPANRVAEAVTSSTYIDNESFSIFYSKRNGNRSQRSMMEQPEVQIYIAGFGKSDDKCLVAEIKEKIVGAVWVRSMKDDRHIDNESDLIHWRIDNEKFIYNRPNYGSGKNYNRSKIKK